MRKQTLKILLGFAFFSSFLGFLQWGLNEKEIVFQTEFNLLSKLPNDWTAFKHPFVLLPFIGQILLVIGLIQKRPRQWLIYTALIMIGVLYLMIFLVGCLGAGYLTALSALPFLTSAFLIIRYFRKLKKNQPEGT